MAITTADYRMWQRLRQSGIVPEKPRILEIGEANWYGDFPLDWWLSELAGMAEAEPRFGPIHREVKRLSMSQPDGWLFNLAKLFYRQFTNCRKIDSWDLHGSGSAIEVDLNEPVESPGSYDVVINTGTAEHVFDVANVFRAMHDACREGGIMYHCLPFRGWLDHGFWSVNPTLIVDLAKANHYNLLLSCYFELNPPRLVWLDRFQDDLHRMEEIDSFGRNALLYVALRKNTDEPFRIPTQGIYRARQSPKLVADWMTFR